MLKRLFDIVFSGLGFLFCIPIFVILILVIAMDSKGGAFYKQLRVGRGGREFSLLKFRTMRLGSDKQGLITVGADSRVTKIGRVLRRFKLDELPQLLNVLKGDMSVVGPRPEVRKYVDFYDERQLRVLDVRPGLTDYASLEYIDEDSLLGAAADADKAYVQDIMPAKLELSLKYIARKSFVEDSRIILSTLKKIISG